MQRNNRIGSLGRMLLCLILSILLLFGITYGRYRQDFPAVSYEFVADGGGTIVLGGVANQSWVDKGAWPAVPSAWTVSGDRASLEFSISNGRAADQFTQRSQAAMVRLVAGLGIGAPENMTVMLSYTQDGQTVTLTGQAEKIQEGTLVYKNYGDGWIYRFYDTVGNEKTFTLSGGKRSYQNLTITLEGETDPILCQLQVMGRYTD